MGEHDDLCWQQPGTGCRAQSFASTSWLTSCSYDLALIGGALGHIRAEFHLSEVMVQVVVGAAKIGAVFGEHTLRCTSQQHACRRLLSPICRAYCTLPCRHLSWRGYDALLWAAEDHWH